MSKLILITAVILSLSIRIFFILNGKHVADIWHIAKMGEVLLKGQNPFLVLDFNVYPPLSIFISVLSQIIGNLTNTSFHIIIKIWPNLADFGTSFIIYKLLRKQRVKPLSASFWTGLFLINPVSIIISAAHGQLDSIVNFFIVLAIYYIKTNLKISALALGLAIAVKPHPLILIPLFLFAIEKNKTRYFLLTLAPIVLSMLPFLIPNPIQVIKGLLTYSGIADFGYAALLRGILFEDNANPFLPETLISGLLNMSKIVLVLSLIVLTLIFRKSKNITKSILLLFLLFITVYFGIGAQYLSWVIPFAIITREKLVLPYILTATIALTGFYLYFGPDLLLGKLTGNMLPFSNKYMYYYFYGNLLLWITCLVWLFHLLIKIPKSVPSIRSNGKLAISEE